MDYVSYYLGQYLSQSGINLVTFIFVLAFLIWEIPRTFSLFEKEWAKGIYEEHGRGIDIFVFIVGIAAFFFLRWNLKPLIKLAQHPIYSIVLAIAGIAMPIVLVIVFIGRIFSRIDTRKEMSELFGHSVLDLAHAIFQISFSLLAFPAAALLISFFL